MDYLKFLALFVLLVLPGAQSAPKKALVKKYSYGNLVVTLPSEEVGKDVAAYDAATDPRQPWELGECLAQPQPQISGRNAITTSYSRWPNNIIPYVFNSSHTASEMTNIMTAISQFESTTCIRFVPRTTEADYISIESQSTGCWSYVGRIFGKQIVNIQSPGCAYTVGTPAHEFMHAAGFFHEHIRSDRDTYVYVNESNVDPTKVAANFYKKSPTEATTLGLPYEYESVMHYSATAFSLDGLPTITALQSGATMGQRNGLTAMDSLKINTFYQCSAPVTPTTIAPPTTPEPVTAEPTTPEPVTSAPTTPEPVTAEPTTPGPVTPGPTTPEPVTAAPTTVAPVTAAPTTVAPSVTTTRSPVPTFRTCFFTRRPR